MPWNEPGGNDNDPWGGGNSNKPKGNGGDNIEDITRKMNEKLGGLFGNKRSSGASGNGGPSTKTLVLLGIGALVLWSLTGFYQVGPAQNGVEFRFGAFQEVTSPGLNWHLPAPIGSKKIVDIGKIRKADDRTQMLTSDENIVDIGIAAQYRVKNAEDYLFNVYLPDYERNQSVGTLFQVMRAAVREVVGGQTMDSILIEDRQSIAPNTQKRMQDILDSYKSGLEVVEVNLEYAQPPQEVKDSFDDVVRAREDQTKFKNEATTYSNKKVQQAEGKASRLSEEAVGYAAQLISTSEGDASRFNQLVSEYEKAPEVTRNRLYLETMEDVYQNTKKIMVDSNSGNNLLYLPLNQVSQPAPRNNAASNFDPATAAMVEQAIRNRQSQQRNTLRNGGRDATRSTR